MPATPIAAETANVSSESGRMSAITRSTAQAYVPDKEEAATPKAALASRKRARCGELWWWQALQRSGCRVGMAVEGESEYSLEPRWPVSLAIMAALLLNLLIPTRFQGGQVFRIVLPLLEASLLI